MFAEKGLVVAQYIKNRRLDLCARAPQSTGDDEKLAGIGYAGALPTIAIFQRRLSSVLASRRVNFAGATANTFEPFSVNALHVFARLRAGNQFLTEGI